MLCMPWVTTDFNEYHRAAVRVSRGETPYQLDDLGYWHCYRYPPAFANGSPAIDVPSNSGSSSDPIKENVPGS